MTTRLLKSIKDLLYVIYGTKCLISDTWFNSQKSIYLDAISISQVNEL